VFLAFSMRSMVGQFVIVVFFPVVVATWAGDQLFPVYHFTDGAFAVVPLDECNAEALFCETRETVVKDVNVSIAPWNDHRCPE